MRTLRQPVARALAVVLALLLGATGCAPLTLDAVGRAAATGDGHLVEGVPFFAQDAYQCGPAALAMVLAFHGLPAEPAAIARDLALPGVQGSLNLELEFYARRRGFRTRAFAGTLESAKAELRRGHPLVVFLDLGVPLVPVPHFAVLIGFDDRAGVVVLHSGTSAHQVVSAREFERTWGARRRWMLLVTPPEPSHEDGGAARPAPWLRPARSGQAR